MPSTYRYSYHPANHAFEIIFLIMVAISSARLTLGNAPAPNTTAALLDPSLLRVWAAMLGGGSLLALAGILWPGRLATSLVLERVGLILVGGAVAIYIWGTLGHATAAASMPLAIVGGVGLACGVRVLQIRRELQTLQHSSRRIRRGT
jgi:hypothetical protein